MLGLNKRDTQEWIGFNDMPYIIPGILIISFLIPFVFFGASWNIDFWVYLPSWLVSMIHTAIYWVLVRGAAISARKKFPNQKDIRKRLLYTGLLVIIVFFVVDWSLNSLEAFCFPEPNGVDPKDFQVKVASLIVIGLALSVYEGIYLNAQWKRALVEREQLKRENVESQLEGLRSQVNPHFLFNSLNTLAYIIPEDPEKGVKFVQKLSKVYRYILEIRDKKLIPVREELDFLKAYCFLLKQRFGENLAIHINVPDSSYGEMVIPLSMQMLFENAIKHNIISSKYPLTIEVTLDGDMLSVTNNLQRKKQSMPSTKVGLQNIKNRYSFFTNQQVEIWESTDTFSVKLPLIQSPKNALV